MSSTLGNIIVSAVGFGLLFLIFWAVDKVFKKSGMGPLFIDPKDKNPRLSDANSARARSESIAAPYRFLIDWNAYAPAVSASIAPQT